jgi:hypothetical protein
MSFPLTVTVYRQSAAPSKPSRATAAAAAPVHVGTAEVDLAGLLWSRCAGTSPHVQVERSASVLTELLRKAKCLGWFCPVG